MTIKLTVPTTTDLPELKPRITVIGVGGAGGNAVNNMIESGLEGVEFVVANSDSQALSHSKAERRIQMGTEVTKGLGAGANPDIGRLAAEESLEEILSQLRDTNMVFVTAGLGGGTGTGAAPVIAKAARDYGILTVGVVTKPFQFEGARRMKMAESGLDELQQFVDTLLIIPNQNLFRVANEKTTFADAFKMADDVLYSGVRGVTDLMVMPGLINLDFADIKSVMSEMGKAMMGTGEAEGERRATEAAEAAIANPLLDDTSMSGAKGVLINITAGPDITLFEVDEAANRIRDEVDLEANIIFGSTFDDSLEGRIRVSVVATGIEAVAGVRPQPIIRQIVPADGKEPVAMVDPAPTPVALFPRPEGEFGKPAEPAIATATVADRAIPAKPEPAVVGITAPSTGGGPQAATAVALQLDEPPLIKEEQSFIPAPPVMGTAALETAAKPDPFAVADMVNASTVEEPIEPPKRSLFEMVTGLGGGERRSAKKQRLFSPAPEKEPKPEVNPVPEMAPVSTPEVLPEIEIVAEIGPEPSIEPAPVMAEDVTQEAPPEIPLKSEPAAAPAVNPFLEAEPEPAGEPEPIPEPESPAEPVESEEIPAPSLLGDLEQADHAAGLEDEDDLLDIPAFLRRQAN